MNWFQVLGFILILMTMTTPAYVKSGMNDELKRGIQLFEERKYTEAKKFFESFTRQNPKNPTAAFYLGRIFLIENNYEQAIDWFEKAIKVDLNNSDFHLCLARAYGIKAQKASIFSRPLAAKKVRKEFEIAVELAPENLDARFGLLQFYLVAPGIMGGSHDKAKEQAEEIKKINSAQGHIASGLIYNFEKKLDLAKKEYLAAIQEDGKTFQAYYQLGYLYSRNKDYDKVFEILESLLNDYPEEIDAYFHIGRISVRAGKNLDRAEECFKKYLQTEPKENGPSKAGTHYMLGLVYHMKGQKEPAKVQYEAALKLDPELDRAKKSLEELK